MKFPEWLVVLCPPVAIVAVISRSIEADQHSRERVVSATVGWRRDDTQAEHIDANGVKEFVKTEREAK